MTRRPSWLVATGLAYLGLVASLFTNAYHPFGVGDDDSGWVLVVFAGAQLALGAAWQTRWSFSLPLPVGIVGVIVAAHLDDPFGVFFAVAAIPVAYVFVGIGRLIGWAARRRGERAAIITPVVLFLIACAPLAEAAREIHHITTGPKLSAREASGLPLTEFTLNELCNTRDRQRRGELTAQAHALVRSTRRHGDYVITASYYVEGDSKERHEDMTVRELAKIQLSALRSYGRNCQPTLQRDLADATG